MGIQNCNNHSSLFDPSSHSTKQNKKMEVSKSDIDFEFDSSDTENGGDNISIATDASSQVRSPLSRNGIRAFSKQLDRGLNLQDDDDDDDEGDAFLSGIGGDDSDNSDLSIGSEELMSPMARNGDDKRVRVHSDEFGPPMVVPLKTGSDHSGSGNMNDPIEPGSRSSRSSRRSNRSGSFHRRAPGRTKSGEGLTASTHSAASGRRRPPPRTKSGEGIVKKDDDVGGVSNHRRRPPPRTKSGNADGIRRRPPQRTKSGGTLRGGRKTDNGEDNEEEEESIYYEEKLPDDDSFDESADPTSPIRRHKSTGHEDSEYREMALKRNSARRQKSSDFLGAMRDATRNMPGRSQSGVGITNGRRRGPSRSKSSGVMPLNDSEEFSCPGTPGRKPLRRKAPARTKSGGTLKSALPLET